MRNFILGVIFTLALLLLIGLSAALLGFLPTNANASPPRWERHLAMSALDASTEKHAARINSPVPPTAENLIDGMKIYTMNCAGCHGGLDRKAVAFGLSFYPPAPPLISDPPTTRTGTPTMSSATASVTPACPPGRKTSAIRTSGRSPSSFPTSKSCPPRRRSTGKTRWVWRRPPAKRPKTTTRNTRAGDCRSCVAPGAQRPSSLRTNGSDAGKPGGARAPPALPLDWPLGTRAHPSGSNHPPIYNRCLLSARSSLQGGRSEGNYAN